MTEALKARVEELEKALRSLSNEVDGWLSLYEIDMRQAGGNTNFSCLETRFQEARAALNKEPST
jgi:hypothetical protein